MLAPEQPIKVIQELITYCLPVYGTIIPFHNTVYAWLCPHALTE